MAAAVVALAHRRCRLHLPAEEEVDQRRLADPAGAEEGERAVAGRVRRDRVEPRTGATAGEQHGHAERDLDELGACRGRVVDEVGLGQHHHRFGSGVERQHELAFEPALVGRRVEGVHEEHDVDVGGDRLGLEAGALERRPAHERRMAVDDVLDAFAVGRRHDPITDRDVGADVADPQRIECRC